MKTWKRRYGILTNKGVLQYFRKKDADAVPLKSIILGGPHICTFSLIQTKKCQNTIQIRGNTNFCFFLDDEDDKLVDLWLEKLHSVGCIFDSKVFGCDIWKIPDWFAPNFMVDLLGSIESKLTTNLFSTRGEKEKFESLVDDLNAQKIVDFAPINVHVLCDVVRLYYGSTISSIFANFYDSLIDIGSGDKEKARRQVLKEIIWEKVISQKKIPAMLLKNLIHLFYVMVSNKDKTKETPNSIALKFISPLLRVKMDHEIEATQIIVDLIEDYQEIFEKYPDSKFQEAEIKRKEKEEKIRLAQEKITKEKEEKDLLAAKSSERAGKGKPLPILNDNSKKVLAKQEFSLGKDKIEESGIVVNDASIIIANANREKTSEELELEQFENNLASGIKEYQKSVEISESPPIKVDEIKSGNPLKNIFSFDVDKREISKKEIDTDTKEKLLIENIKSGNSVNEGLIEGSTPQKPEKTTHKPSGIFNRVSMFVDWVMAPIDNAADYVYDNVIIPKFEEMKKKAVFNPSRSSKSDFIQKEGENDE